MGLLGGKATCGNRWRSTELVAYLLECCWDLKWPKAIKGVWGKFPC